MALFLGLWVRDVGRGLAPAVQDTHGLGQIRTLCCSGGTNLLGCACHRQAIMERFAALCNTLPYIENWRDKNA